MRIYQRVMQVNFVARWRFHEEAVDLAGILFCLGKNCWMCQDKWGTGHHVGWDFSLLYKDVYSAILGLDPFLEISYSWLIRSIMINISCTISHCIPITDIYVWNHMVYHIFTIDITTLNIIAHAWFLVHCYSEYTWYYQSIIVMSLLYCYSIQFSLPPLSRWYSTIPLVLFLSGQVEYFYYRCSIY